MSTGAHQILAGLTDAGITILFTNPGTTEIHFVDALGRLHELQSVLTLTEAVAAGAADGFARITDQPSAILLHLGPGLANATAYLHNAKRAHSPIVVLVGEHSTGIKPLDPPLASDIDALAHTFSKAVFHASFEIAPRHSAAKAGFAALEGTPGPVTLIVPSDLAWSEFDDAQPLSKPIPLEPSIDPAVLAEALTALAAPAGTTVVVGGTLLHDEGAPTLARLLAQSNLTVVTNTFTPRIDRSPATQGLRRLPYLPEMAATVLKDTRKLVVIGGQVPVPFFGYPHLPDRLLPEGCEVIQVTTNPRAALGAARQLIENSDESPSAPIVAPPTQTRDGQLTPAGFAAVMSELLPSEAVVVDESNTLGIGLEEATAYARRHTWLPALSGGAIGHGLPLAIGVALAAPGRKVIALIADGSSLYSHQALWTHAAQNLDILTVVLINRSYAILNFELDRLGSTAATDDARRLLSLAPPPIDHAQIAGGLGVASVQVATLDSLRDALVAALGQQGPRLVAVEFN
ncbi:MAG: acetolactate synthase large subunit [Ferrimicrobium sp.]|jgi:acetolactate synthase-1/2/3 large subunit|uniref:acetolactate synthase large subunit n=1 Tax=Ferrimicrobium sp. TaxID=2926050 RepID=UPI002610CEB4|nr:acetolactate synthase large subunit [Ferrimicrobium sp.]MCL5974149.1 acetolactate synthase large subunit [Actinomycetota bacterium]